MFLTGAVITIFLLVIISESFYLGKYFSVNQNIFSGNILAAFALGFAIYITSSFVMLLPLQFLSLGIYYYLVFIIIKDFIILIFLITRSNIIKMHANEYKIIVYIIISAMFFILIHEFVFSKFLDLKSISNISNNSFFKNYLSPISSLLVNDELITIKYLLYPVGSIIIVTCLGAISANFIKSINYKTFIIINILVISLFLLNNFGDDMLSFVGQTMLVFLFFISYRIFIFSRRRYATAFGVTTVAIWSINRLYFMPIISIATAFAILYTIFVRKKSFQFSLQIYFPVLILNSIRLSKISTTLAIIIFIIGSISYFMLFYFRFHTLKFDNKIMIWLLNYFGVIIIASALVLWSLINILVNGISWNETVFSPFMPINNISFMWIRLTLYMIAIGFHIILAIYFRYKNKGRKWDNFAYYITLSSLIICVFMFNPFFANALKNIDIEFNKYLSVIPSSVILIDIVWIMYSYLRNNNVTIMKKNKTKS